MFIYVIKGIKVLKKIIFLCYFGILHNLALADTLTESYFGLVLGVSDTDAKLSCSYCDLNTFSDYLPGDSTKQNDDSSNFGLKIGRDFIKENFFYGAEVSYLDLNYRDKTWSDPTPAHGGNTEDDTFTSTIDSTFILAGRVGKKFENFKFFAKTGLAFADYKLKINDYNTQQDGTDTGNSTGSGSKSHWVNGYVFGFGTEYMLNNKISIGAEYTRIAFNSKKFNAGGDIDYVMKTKKLDSDLYQLNLNYYF